MKTTQKGFSLIELLVVIAIIGILAAVGTTGYQSYIDSAKNSSAVNNAAAILSALKNEDLAMQAGAGAYDNCAAATVAACVDDIVSASTLVDPFNSNADYTLSTSAGGDSTIYVGTATLACAGSGQINIVVSSTSISAEVCSASGETVQTSTDWSQLKDFAPSTFDGTIGDLTS